MDSKQTIQIIPAPAPAPSAAHPSSSSSSSSQRRPSAGGRLQMVGDLHPSASAPPPGTHGARPRASSLSERMRTGGGTASGRGNKGGGDSLAPPLDTLSEHGAELALDKALGSDIDDEQAFYLLRSIAQNDRAAFHAMTDRDLRVLCHLFSVLKLPKGEEIMKIGEQATFFALVLAGELTAVLESGASFGMPAGSWLGEMAFFEGGGRSADIVVASDALLAVVSYDELNNLRVSHSDMYSKLVKMLAVVSLQKLRGQIERLTDAKTTAAANTVLAASAPGTPTAADRQHLAAVSVARVSAPVVKKQHAHHGDSKTKQPVTASPGGGGGARALVALTASGRTKPGAGSQKTLNSGEDAAVAAAAPARPETLYAKRLAKEPKLRPELYLTGLHHVQLPAAAGQPPNAPESNPLMAFTGPQLLSLDRDTAQKLFGLYHQQSTSTGTSGGSKGMESREMRVLARDVAERVLWNFAESVKKREPDVSAARLLELVNDERPYLLPRAGDGAAQPDKTVIGNMSKHLQTSLSIDPSKARKITSDMFCLQWNKAMKQLLHGRVAGADGKTAKGKGAQSDGGMSCCML